MLKLTPASLEDIVARQEIRFASGCDWMPCFLFLHVDIIDCWNLCNKLTRSFCV
jgi:hypothetical protein